MWGLADRTPWRAWPHGMAPDVAALLTLSRGEDRLVALLGGANGERARYGVVGVPGSIEALDPAPQAVLRACDERPRDALRVLALGYELGAPLVRLSPSAPPAGQPAGLALDLSAALLVDHRERTYAVAGGDREAARRLLEAAEADPAWPHSAGAARLEPTLGDAEHARRIRLAQEHILAGDIYQANITRRLSLSHEIDGAAAAALLSRRNPVAHAAYLRAGPLELASNSMETLLTYAPAERLARSFPIKGTRRRPPESDEVDVQLALDEKERAEHVMIVDLVRNDLGRVATAGSVRVPRLMGVEGFRGVWHGVSTIEARLREDATLGALVSSSFPGGSITGAPKRRAMEIIAELEAEPRGLYTGSLGFIAPDGTTSLSILIRTLVRDARGWSLNVGGGIVADSRPEREIEETWEKVAVFAELLAPTRGPT